MKNVFFLLFVFYLVSCQSDSGSGAGTVIIFGDVVGAYTGECADYNPNTSELMNREDATLSIIAVSLQEAEVKPSCARFEDLQLKVKSSSAEEIIFEKINSESQIITLKYIAANDSIILSQSDTSVYNLLFAGIRQ